MTEAAWREAWNWMVEMFARNDGDVAIIEEALQAVMDGARAEALGTTTLPVWDKLPVVTNSPRQWSSNLASWQRTASTVSGGVTDLRAAIEAMRPNYGCTCIDDVLALVDGLEAS